MKREIKFRAWDKELGMSGSISFEEIINAENGTDLNEFEIIMQYTGLKDKNGKEIYEGDILEDGKKQKGQVLWHRNSYLVEWQERGYDGHLLQDRMYDDCFGYGEIIGNIYENPELIKK